MAKRRGTDFIYEPIKHRRSNKNQPHLIRTNSYTTDFDKEIIEEYNEYLEQNYNPRKRHHEQTGKRRRKRELKRRKRIKRNRNFDPDFNFVNRTRREDLYLKTGKTKQFYEKKKNKQNEIAQIRRRDSTRGGPEEIKHVKKPKAKPEMSEREKKLREAIRALRRRQEENDKKKPGEYKLVAVYY